MKLSSKHGNIGAFISRTVFWGVLSRDHIREYPLPRGVGKKPMNSLSGP